jgi:hypothetical protein
MLAARALPPGSIGRIGIGDPDVITEVEAAKVRTALNAARAGSGTLTQLAEAYDIAAAHDMTATREELLVHIRARLPKEKLNLSTSTGRKTAIRNLSVGIGLGILAGIGTHFVLVAVGERQRGQ